VSTSETFADLGRILVVIPTYNEAENVEPIVSRVRAAVPEAHVLIADDNSPDGTGDLADKLAAADGNVQVLHRKGKEGLGAAYVASFKWGMERDYDVLVEMDADGSHQPEQLARLLAALRDADLVIGSRYIPGGKVQNWPVHRLMISRIGGIYTRVALGVPIADPTAGYRAFRRTTLEGISLDDVDSAGYCFQVDLGWRSLKAGFKVVEVPITFIERERGQSKMSQAIVLEAMAQVGRWGVAHRLGQLRRLGRRLTGRRAVGS
jgi:dolichol-phosphate mannosyltransferase